MPIWEIAIKGKFVTGTTIDDEEEAKRVCEKLLEMKMADAGFVREKDHDLFQWIPESVEAEALSV